ncbi:MAG TPA: hypothetical protein PLP23_22215 [Panacibacter sp.]|nr:hypothetical protein [Panacibacter sp.]
MKKVVSLAIVVLVLSSCIYAIVYFFAIPQTAAQLVPYKWRSVSTGQKKYNYENYLGRPENIDSLQQLKPDRWIIRNGNYSYFLNIAYGTDTTGNNVSIEYQFSNGLFYKNGVLKSINTN